MIQDVPKRRVHRVQDHMPVHRWEKVPWIQNSTVRVHRAHMKALRILKNSNAQCAYVLEEDAAFEAGKLNWYVPVHSMTGQLQVAMPARSWA